MQHLIISEEQCEAIFNILVESPAKLTLPAIDILRSLKPAPQTKEEVRDEKKS